MKSEVFFRGKRGVDLLHDPLLNKGTAFNEAERQTLGLEGLLPPRINSTAQQLERVLDNLRSKADPLEKYIFLISLQDRNETLFYRLVMDHLEEMVPLIYTPTVGRACERYGHVFRRARGLYVSLHDRGRVRDVLDNWPSREVRMIVFTDGERILGLGDLGADGMGIPVGKLSLYTACAGVFPEQCLPVTLDVGTDNEELLADPLYVGLPHRRVRGADYDALIEEFMVAAHEAFPAACLQFEDFGNANAFRLLRRYRNLYCTFNDDIQGTGSVTLAGIYSALRLTGERLADQRFLFFGAGEAGIGIADTLVAALHQEGMSGAEARRRCWLVDSRGLVVAERAHLSEHKLRYAHPQAAGTDLPKIIERLQPTAIIGASAVPGAFTERVVRAMARQNRRPIVFALSNPTSRSECTAEQAYTWSDGRAIFASGSPFDPVTLNGVLHEPGQANNAYIFPGLGMGLMLSHASRVTDEMLLVAARALADRVTSDDLAHDRVFPRLTHIRDISHAIATAVGELVYAHGLSDAQPPVDFAAHVREHMYQPDYHDYTAEQDSRVGAFDEVMSLASR